MASAPATHRVALIEAGSPGLNIYSHVAMGRGVGLLATVLRDRGYDVRAFIEDVSGKDSIDWAWVCDAGVVGFSAITCTMPRTRDLISRARAENPKATILLGGPEPTCAPERSFEAGADLVLRGEAELTLPRLLAVLFGESEESLADIEGAVWREEGALRQGPPARQLVRDELDALPLLDRSLIHNARRISVAPVWRARGCPSRCDFCEVCEIWPRYIARDPEITVDELVEAQDDGYGTVFLIDDNAAANKPAFKELLRDAARRGFARGLVTQIRADSVFDREGRLDKELLKLLKKAASLTVVCIGVESSSDEDLARLNKGIDSSRMAKALKAMRRYGLLVHGMFIALSEDSAEVIHRNGEYARKYVTSLQYLFETPLPGTKRTKEHELSGTLLFRGIDDLSLYDGMHVVVRPRFMTPTEMEYAVLREYERFYSVKRIVVEALKGTFVRFRRLPEAQREFVANLPSARKRIGMWFRLHVEYKYGPVAFLAVGRKRINEFLHDAEYAEYLTRLTAL
jgi:radical SAM superfamily enzyme YgiQ (UPF0313 family)